LQFLLGFNNKAKENKKRHKCCDGRRPGDTDTGYGGKREFYRKYMTVRIPAEIYPIARIWIFRRKSKEKRNPAKRPKSPAGKRQSYFQAIKDRRERRREYFIRPPV
jgi:hypothetical protein